MALLIHVELFFGIPLFFLGLYDFAPSYTGSPSLSSRMKIRATPAWMGLGDCDHGLEIMVNAWCCFHFVGTCTCLRSTWTYDGRIARGQQALEPFVHLFASVVGSQRTLARPQAVTTSRGTGPPLHLDLKSTRSRGVEGGRFPRSMGGGRGSSGSGSAGDSFDWGNGHLDPSVPFNWVFFHPTPLPPTGNGRIHLHALQTVHSTSPWDTIPSYTGKWIVPNQNPKHKISTRRKQNQGEGDNRRDACNVGATNRHQECGRTMGGWLGPENGRFLPYAG